MLICPSSKLTVTKVAGLLCASLLVCSAAASLAEDKAPAPAPPASASVNLALNKKFVSTSPNKYKWDGLTDGSWVPTAPTCYATDQDDVFPKSVTIDLEKSSKIASVVIGIPAFGTTKNVEVSISTDGTTFKPVGTNQFEQRKEVKYTYSFPAADARYVRLTYKDHWDEQVNYPKEYVFTEEVEVYAPTK